MTRDPDCLFCKILDRKVPAAIVHEDNLALAFQDIHPQAPTHILVVPKQHIADIHSMKNSDREMVGHLFYIAQTVAEKLELNKSGYRMVINNGRSAGQTVFHLHLHLLSGRSFSWPPG